MPHLEQIPQGLLQEFCWMCAIGNIDFYTNPPCSSVTKSRVCCWLAILFAAQQKDAWDAYAPLFIRTVLEGWHLSHTSPSDFYQTLKKAVDVINARSPDSRSIELCEDEMD